MRVVILLCFLAFTSLAQMPPRVLDDLMNVAMRPVTSTASVPFTVEVVTTDVNQTFVIGVNTATNLLVSWGNTASTNVNSTSAAISLTNTYAAAGTYNITIGGATKGLTFGNDTATRGRLKRVLTPMVGIAGITTLASMFSSCNGLYWMPSDMVNTLTNVNSLGFTWSYCSSATNFPAVSNLTKVNSLASTWTSCSKMVDPPAVNTLTNVNSLKSTWQACSSATNFPDVNNLTLVNTLNSTWYSCSKMTNCPTITASTLITNANSTYWKSYAVIGASSGLYNAGNFPNIVNFTNCYNGCSNLSDYASIPAAWK